MEVTPKAASANAAPTIATETKAARTLTAPNSWSHTRSERLGPVDGSVIDHQPVPVTPHGFDRPAAKRGVNLFPQVANVNLDYVRVEVSPPDAAHQLVFCHSLAKVGKQLSEKVELALRKLYLRTTSRAPARAEVQDQVPCAQHL